MSDGIVGYTNSDVASPLQACILRTGSSSQRVDRRWKRNNFVNIRCLSGAQTTDGVTVARMGKCDERVRLVVPLCREQDRWRCGPYSRRALEAEALPRPRIAAFRYSTLRFFFQLVWLHTLHVVAQ